MDLFGRHDADLPFELPQGDAYKATWAPELSGFRVTIPHGELVFAQNFYDRMEADRVVDFLQTVDGSSPTSGPNRSFASGGMEAVRFTNIRWRQESIHIYGKVHPLPRLTSWYGDEGASYSYSGIDSRPNPWNSGLEEIRRRVTDVAAEKFNSVLLNWYRNGSDKLDWHADDEPELGRNPTIASLSFGASRDFVMRLGCDHTTKIRIPLGHGALLIMRGALQEHWQHAVPKRVRVDGSRFNLTFRRIVTGS